MSRLLVGLGEILWDLLPSGMQLGGAPANFAFHARALGADAVVASSVGADEPGRGILDHLDSLGLNHDYIITDPVHPTGAVWVNIDRNGNPAYVIHEHVAWDFLPLTRQWLGLAGRADAICFGSLAQRSEVSRTTIRALLEKTSPNALRIFDVNLRAPFFTREVIETSLQLATVLKVSRDELPVVARLLSMSEHGPILLNTIMQRYNLRLIALTRGGEGSVLYSGGRSSDHPGYRVEVIDSVGAGDAFTAALALGMLKGYDLDRINDSANRVASFVCSQAGATPALPEECTALF
ncbi:MAG: carbohydrate kinase [Acidobacteriia bacterium]|nr:carbohydrate kinase [Terriglobia bacterium]